MTPRITPPPATLNKWDIAFIRLFKQDLPPSETLIVARNLWAERCEVHPEHVNIGYVAEYLATLVDRLNLTPSLVETLNYMNPANGWKIGATDQTSHNERAVLMFSSWLALTEVKYLPGYREAIEAAPGQGSP